MMTSNHSGNSYRYSTTVSLVHQTAHRLLRTPLRDVQIVVYCSRYYELCESSGVEPAFPYRYAGAHPNFEVPPVRFFSTLSCYPYNAHSRERWYDFPAQLQDCPQFGKETGCFS